MADEKVKGKLNKKLICLAAALVTLICGIAAFAIYEYKSLKSRENQFYPAEISNAVDENDDGNTSATEEKNLTWQASGSTYTAQKEVKILNVDADDENNTDAYIRVTMIPRWVQTIDGTEVDITTIDLYTQSGELTDINIEDNTFTLGAVSFTLTEGWDDNWIFNPGDGYFYYKDIVPEGEYTEPLLESVSITKDTYNSMEDGVSLRIDIISDSIQAEGSAVAARWGDSGISIDTEDENLSLKLDAEE
jgi:uncharacterized protein YxeA